MKIKGTKQELLILEECILLGSRFCFCFAIIYIGDVDIKECF